VNKDDTLPIQKMNIYVDRMVKQTLSRCWYHLEVWGHKESVQESECSGNIMYLYMKNGKMRYVEMIPGMGGWGAKGEW
jgi:hypothetical protein